MFSKCLKRICFLIGIQGFFCSSLMANRDIWVLVTGSKNSGKTALIKMLSNLLSVASPTPSSSSSSTFSDMTTRYTTVRGADFPNHCLHIFETLGFFQQRSHNDDIQSNIRSFLMQQIGSQRPILQVIVPITEQIGDLRQQGAPLELTRNTLQTLVNERIIDGFAITIVAPHSEDRSSEEVQQSTREQYSQLPFFKNFAIDQTGTLFSATTNLFFSGNLKRILVENILPQAQGEENNRQEKKSEGPQPHNTLRKRNNSSDLSNYGSIQTEAETLIEFRLNLLLHLGIDVRDDESQALVDALHKAANSVEAEGASARSSLSTQLTAAYYQSSAYPGESPTIQVAEVTTTTATTSSEDNDDHLLQLSSPGISLMTVLSVIFERVRRSHE